MVVLAPRQLFLEVQQRMLAVAVVAHLTPQELPVQVAQEAAGLVARLEMAQEQQELPI
jgi:hypothetical protein